MSPTIESGPARELPEVRAGRLPERYGYPMQEVLIDRLRPLLKPEIAILDVGGGRAPTLSVSVRPDGCRYTGLDVSAEELASSTPGAYTDTLVADITQPLSFKEPYDVVLSWQVLEHVKPIDRALENLRGALKPGGTMLAQLSGSRAVFSLLARVVPNRLRVAAMSRLLGHATEEKFPTRHDRRTASELREMLRTWADAEIIPFYRGATYFAFNRPLQRAYLAYEGHLERRAEENLATHYLIVARK